MSHQDIKNTTNIKSTLFKKNKVFLSHITFYLEDYDQKQVDFKGKTIPFTCHLLKIFSLDPMGVETNEF